MSNGMQKFIDSLELPLEGQEKGRQYIINIPDSNLFSRIFNLIDINKELNLKGQSKATDLETEFRFTNGIYDVILSADYEDDVYRLTVEAE